MTFSHKSIPHLPPRQKILVALNKMIFVSIHYSVAPCQGVHLVALFLDAATNIWTASVMEFQTGEGEAALDIA